MIPIGKSPRPLAQVRPVGSAAASLRALRTPMLRALAAVASAGLALWLYTSIEAARFLVEGKGFDSGREDLARVLGGFEGQSIFGIDAGELREGLLALPGVGDVRFERRLPHWMRIRIVADRPVVLINDDELVTRHRRVWPRRAWLEAGAGAIQAAQLPRLSLPSDYPRERYGEMVARFVRLSETLRGLDDELVALRLSETSSLTLVTASGMEIMLCRQQDPMPSVRRLSRIWRDYLGSVGVRIRRINLCYPNGLSWQAASESTKEVSK